MPALPILTTAQARTLFLDGQYLLADPARRAGPVAVQKIVQQLGFVQIDSIIKIERAHHLILGARLDHYRAEHLEHAAFRKRVLFEHWTHDAALIPLSWFKYWKPRFLRTEQRLRKSRWFTHRLGNDPESTIAHVRERIQQEGALQASDFVRTAARPATGWWDWTPEKAALEFLWHTGYLSIAGRDRFQKIYDLTERVFPDVHRRESPLDAEHIDWACREALARLGTATSGELAAFFAAITPAQAAQWCRQQLATGDIVTVAIESLDTGNSNTGKPRPAFALPNWRRQLRQCDDAPDRIRLLAPFDPVVRDRKRLQRLFGFDYRFEAFVPAKQRQYGYYVLPMLEGDRFVGRLDPRHDRETQTLRVDNIWWQPGIKASRERKRKLNDALQILAKQIGAKNIRIKAKSF